MEPEISPPHPIPESAPNVVPPHASPSPDFIYSERGCILSDAILFYGRGIIHKASTGLTAGLQHNSPSSFTNEQALQDQVETYIAKFFETNPGVIELVSQSQYSLDIYPPSSSTKKHSGQFSPFKVASQFDLKVNWDSLVRSSNAPYGTWVQQDHVIGHRQAYEEIGTAQEPSIKLGGSLDKKRQREDKQGQIVGGVGPAPKKLRQQLRVQTFPAYEEDLAIQNRLMSSSHQDSKPLFTTLPLTTGYPTLPHSAPAAIMGFAPGAFVPFVRNSPDVQVYPQGSDKEIHHGPSANAGDEAASQISAQLDMPSYHPVAAHSPVDAPVSTSRRVSNLAGLPRATAAQQAENSIAEDGASSQQSQVRRQARKWGSTRPDTSIITEKEGKNRLWLVIEYKYAKISPGAPDYGYCLGSIRRQAVYQDMWYLFTVYPLHGLRLGIAIAHDRFTRLCVLDDGSVAIEVADGVSVPSEQLTAEGLDNLDFWDGPGWGHRLVDVDDPTFIRSVQEVIFAAAKSTLYSTPDAPNLSQSSLALRQILGQCVRLPLTVENVVRASMVKKHRERETYNAVRAKVNAFVQNLSTSTSTSTSTGVVSAGGGYGGGGDDPDDDEDGHHGGGYAGGSSGGNGGGDGGETADRAEGSEGVNDPSDGAGREGGSAGGSAGDIGGGSGHGHCSSDGGGVDGETRVGLNRGARGVRASDGSPAIHRTRTPDDAMGGHGDSTGRCKRLSQSWAADQDRAFQKPTMSAYDRATLGATEYIPFADLAEDDWVVDREKLALRARANGSRFRSAYNLLPDGPVFRLCNPSQMDKHWARSLGLTVPSNTQALGTRPFALHA